MSSLTTKRPDPRDGPAAAVTTDDFLGGRISIAQPRTGHRAGSDAVFLAAAVPARPGERVLDAGGGVGVAGLCLLARVPRIEVTAVEIDPRLCMLAVENAAANGFAEQFSAINADVTSPGKALAAAGLRRESHDHVIANPPFHAEGRVRPAPDRSRATAHVMRGEALAAWVRFFAGMTAPDGLLTLIHRPDTLGELLGLLDGRFGALAIFPLFAKRGEAASRIIVQGRKGSRAGLSLLPGLVLHEADGSYTPEAEAVLRGGQAVEIAYGQRKGRRLGG